MAKKKVAEAATATDAPAAPRVARVRLGSLTQERIREIMAGKMATEDLRMHCAACLPQAPPRKRAVRGSGGRRAAIAALAAYMEQYPDRWVAESA